MFVNMLLVLKDVIKIPNFYASINRGCYDTIVIPSD